MQDDERSVESTPEIPWEVAKRVASKREVTVALTRYAGAMTADNAIGAVQAILQSGRNAVCPELTLRVAGLRPEQTSKILSIIMGEEVVVDSGFGEPLDLDPDAAQAKF